MRDREGSVLVRKQVKLTVCVGESAVGEGCQHDVRIIIPEQRHCDIAEGNRPISVANVSPTLL